MKTHLIIVDSDQSLATGVALALQGMFDQITVLQSPLALRDAILPERQTVILSEIHFPIGDGVTMLRNLKESAPQSQIIALSAYFTEKTVNELRQAGIDKIVEKPIQMESLRAEIEDVILK